MTSVQDIPGAVLLLCGSARSDTHINIDGWSGETNILAADILPLSAIIKEWLGLNNTPDRDRAVSA
jgi:hypothetical protein